LKVAAAYISLHNLSYYSFLTGLCAPKDLVQAAQDQGMSALALTDRHGLTGALDFYVTARAAGIKPILGLELKINHPLGSGDLVFLAQDLTGWGSLCRLSSWVQAQPQRDPELGLDFEILAANVAGLFCLTGGVNGLVNRLVTRGNLLQARSYLEALTRIFPDNLFVELIDPSNEAAPNLAQSVTLAAEIGLPVVATHPVYYLTSAQADLQRTLSTMRQNTTREGLPPESAAPSGSYFKPSAEMMTQFGSYPVALENSHRIAEACNLELPLDRPHYPEVQLPNGESPDSLLRSIATEGMSGRYGTVTPEIQARLDHELKIIADRGYAPLFLIVQEILEYARKTGVPISSRGSAASSLVAYALGITTPDPMALNLYFERFLNPARKTPPDIDTDLCSRRRDEVLRHVFEKYGTDRVAMVATINRFRPRSALREVAKAYGLSTKDINTLVAELPYRGWGGSNRRGGSGDPFESLISQYPDSVYQAIFRDAQAIQNFPRHLSVHPGGIVITPTPMTDLVPTHLASKGMIITQFDLWGVEKLGLVKIDLLGTRGLTVIGDVAESVRSWRAAEFGTPLDVLTAIPTDDPDTANLINSGHTIGCFQIESPGMRATLKEIDAASPADIMVALALYRPGPMTGGLKDAFIQRHLGRAEVEHIHPALESLLADTYGVILYQEQVLLIASQLAGLSLADADLLRRAMSHFDPGDRMKTLQQRFVTGALEKNEVPPEVGTRIWDLMAAFAGYGFPKAHAASYAEVSWRSAWCKAHYPAEFITAVLAGWGGYYRQRVYLNEARRLGLPLKAPHINYAQSQFSVTYPHGKPTLYMGLGQVKELSRRTIRRIRAHRPFRTVDDFLTRVDPRPIEAENLIRVGALQGLGTISELLARLKFGGWAYGQPTLFSMPIESGDSTWDLSRRMEAQVQILGTSVDIHPLELYADHIANLEAISVAAALSKLDETVTVVGIRQTVQRFFAHAGHPFHILELEDQTGVLPVYLTPDFYHQHRPMLQRSNPMVITGKLRPLETTGELVLAAERLFPL
jgi:DNA polymerase III subunit alpha